jgi:hypothetical protein
LGALDGEADVGDRFERQRERALPDDSGQQPLVPWELENDVVVGI